LTVAKATNAGQRALACASLEKSFEKQRCSPVYDGL
jgi:hypothetical protein